MRKLTGEELLAHRAAQAAKKAHVHDDTCGHLVATAPAEEVTAPADGAPAETAEEAPAEEAPAEEAPAEDKPKRKYTKKSAEETPAEEA
jgi:hypothetical protein